MFPDSWPMDGFAQWPVIGSGAPALSNLIFVPGVMSAVSATIGIASRSFSSSQVLTFAK